MAEILKFTGKRVRDIEVDDGFNKPEMPQKEIPAAALGASKTLPYIAAPVHGGYPSVVTTAAVDVVQTLAFYANGGTDQGTLALKTLRGINGVVDAANS